MSSQVVVLGASGFVGRAACQALVELGAEVVAVARRPQAPLAGVRVVQIERYEGLPEFPGAVCLHAAAESVPARVAEAPERFTAEAVALSAKVASAPFRKVVFVSSAVVYGSDGERPFTEADEPKPVGAYAQLKLAAEAPFRAPPHVVARLSNVYGVGMSTVNVLSDVLRQVGQAGPVRLRDLAPVRDYVHVGDVARALALLCVRDVSGVFNVSSGVGTSVLELARAVLAAAGEPERAVEGTSSTTPSRLVLAAGAVEAAVGWQATVRLVDGLAALSRA